MNPALGNDHIVGVGVDEADGAVIVQLLECCFGVAGEAPDLLAPAVARGRYGDASHLGRQRAFLPGFRVEIDLVPGAHQAAAEVNDVGFSSAPRWVDSWEIQGQPHGSALPERTRR